MSRGNPKPLTKWAKGQSGNPNGRPPDDPVLKAFKQLGKQQLCEVCSVIMLMNIQDLQQLVRNKKASVLQVMVAAVAVKIIKQGGMLNLDLLLNRVVGKVKDTIDFNGSGQFQVVKLAIPGNGKESKTEKAV